MIPEAAFDAAVSALTKGRPLLPEYLEAKRADARAALEAAAPHMQETQWGVRDIVSLHIAGHPSEESARSIAAEHPQWYEVVCRPMPGIWRES